MVYATRVSSLTSLAAQTANTASPVTLASIRPSFNPLDQWSWNVYDNAGRVIETISSVGAVITFTYDGASNLISTTTYANQLSGTTLSTLQTTPPTSLTLPTANTSLDQTTKNFYDADGRLTDVINALGYVTQYSYDAAGGVGDLMDQVAVGVIAIGDHFALGVDRVGQTTGVVVDRARGLIAAAGGDRRGGQGAVGSAG